MARQYRVTWQIRLTNNLTSLMAYLGVGGPMSVLTTTGRRSGKERTTTVSPIEVGGVEYLVAPYGEVGWVKNVRARPQVRLRRGRSVRDVTLSTTDGREAASVVQAYHKREAFARRYMDVPENPTLEDFLEAGGGYPVFRVG
jgi:deazaflavin-dependent oxidoreductase (nitroreductase family)